MKILAMAALAAATGTVSARNVNLRAGPVVPVCMESAPSLSWAGLIQARGLASKMFAAARVTINWRSWDNCPDDGIKVSLSWNTQDSDHPHAFAYALPYEGTHIVVFWDRIARVEGYRAHIYLLAHVLVHEVTHILQGKARHSDTGVMKATFTVADILTMDCKPLPFTSEDLELIHSGLRNRQARLAR